jgi:tetratricopeptide (TPR) repeat protein
MRSGHIGAAILSFICLLSAQAKAEDASRNQQATWCQAQTGGANAVSPDVKVGGCTWLLQSGTLSPAQVAIVLVYRSNAYAAKHDEVHQVEDLDQAVAADPHSAFAFAASCSAHTWVKIDTDRAMKECTTAVTLDPKSVDGWTFRGDIYLSRHQYDLAIADYDHAISLSADWMWPWDNRGEAYLRSGKYDRAIEDFDQVIKISPDYAMGFLDRGIARIKQNQLDAAQADFETALKVQPDSPSVRYGLGIVKQRKGDVAGGTADIMAALAMSPKASSNFDDDGVSALSSPPH